MMELGDIASYYCCFASNRVGRIFREQDWERVRGTSFSFFYWGFIIMFTV